MSAHGYVRATEDVDFVARIPLAEVQKRLQSHGMAASVKRGDALEGDFPCVKATVAGIRVDVMPELVPLEWSRSVEVALTKTAALRIVDLDGLLRLKLRARGPRDLMDVAALVLRHPERRDRALEAATAYGVARELAGWLSDRRLRDEIPPPPRKPRTRPASRRSPRRRRARRRATPRS